MPEISRTASFGKLNPVAYKAIESATVFCKMRGNPFVELPHWLMQILGAADSDLHRIVRHYELDAAALSRDLTQALDRLPRGASSISDISPKYAPGRSTASASSPMPGTMRLMRTAPSTIR